MEYVQLGAAGVRVSRLCLGTMNAGLHPGEEPELVATIHAALDAGINFVDTADVYGRGVSEAIVGRALKGRRDTVMLATKVYGEMSDDTNDRGTSRRHVKLACEASLRRLQVDSIDLYQLHVYDSATPLEESLGALDDLIRAGTVHYAGVSNFPAWRTVEAVAVARERNLASSPVSTQPPYSLLDRRVESELLPMARAYGLAVLPWSPLAGGVLTGRYRDGEIPPGTRLEHWRRLGERMRSVSETVDLLEQIAADAGLELADLALAWLLHQPDVTSVVIGPRNRAHLAAAIGALEVELDAGVLAAVDEAVAPRSAPLSVVA